MLWATLKMCILNTSYLHGPLPFVVFLQPFFLRVTIFGMSSSLCILSAFSPLSSGDNTSFFQPGLTVSDGLRVRSATRTVTFCRFSQWDVWTSMFGNDTKMKKDVYLVNIKHSWIYTGPLHFSLSSSSSPPLLLRCDMLQLSPSLRISNMSICLSVNCTPLSCGFFYFFTQGCCR